MKPYRRCFMAMCVVLCLLAGCRSTTQPQQSVALSAVQTWPDNRFTALVPLPPGTPYAASAQADGDFYAVCLRAVSSQQSSAYAAQLEQAGFSRVFYVEESAATAAIYAKEGCSVHLCWRATRLFFSSAPHNPHRQEKGADAKHLLLLESVFSGIFSSSRAQPQTSCDA